ncbi:MAG: gamma-glutamyl-gamma-aminobutyrate hydrolase family protein [Actinomycetota bacterium]
MTDPTVAETKPTPRRYRALIAVVAYHLGSDRVARWPDGGYGVPAPYLDSLRRAGARIAIIPPGEQGDPDELLEPFDGLLLVGGGDVDPARYGADPDTEHNYGVEPDRDDFEIALLHAADRLHLPTFCICRGMQVMNVAYGGSLHQHLPDMPGLLPHGVPIENTESLHEVTPEPGTLLSATTKSGPLACSSHHHQGIDRVGEGIVVGGRSSDGLVESIELRGADGNDVEHTTWMLGVQWHPEETAASDPAQKSLFDAFVNLARWRSQRARPGDAIGRSRVYSVVDPDTSWPDRYDAESARIVSAVPAGLVSRIDHVGSTSVPGLAAKPVVDIQLSVTSMVPREAYVGPLTGLGYRWVPDGFDDTHEFFAIDGGDGRAVNLHVTAAGSEWERRHLAFRDALRADPDTAAAYADLKRTLAANHPRDIVRYVEGKSAFVRSVEDRVSAPSD